MKSPKSPLTFYRSAMICFSECVLRYAFPVCVGHVRFKNSEFLNTISVNMCYPTARFSLLFNKATGFGRDFGIFEFATDIFFAVYWLDFALVIIPVFVAPNNIFWFWIPDTDYFLPYFDPLYWCSLLTYLFFFLIIHFTYKECFYYHQLFTEVCCSM